MTAWLFAHFWWLFTAACLALAVAIGGTVIMAGRRRTGCPRWPLACECRGDGWEPGWQVEPYTDEDATRLVADLTTDLPGRSLAFDGARVGESRAGAGELHHSQERTVTRDVWNEWWQGLDGLDRECLTVTRWREREERLWAELKDETKDLCPLAMAA